MNKEIKETNDLAYLVATAIVSDKTAQETAEYLYKKGYRKQSDTVKDFVGKLKALPRDIVHSYQIGCIVLSDADIDKLAKEYGVE